MPYQNTYHLSPVLVELLEHPGGLTGCELGHADVGALDTFISNRSLKLSWERLGGTHVVHEVVDGVDTYILV